MFNLHVGIPGIAVDLLTHSQLTAILAKNIGHRVVQDHIWRENFRSAVNNGEGDDIGSRLKWKLARDTVKELADVNATTISQHALLGRTGDCFIRSVAFPKTAERISHLSDIFGKHEVVIHLTVASQFDYLRLALQRSTRVQPFTVPKIVPSWSDLVQRVQAAAPGRRIVVWDFEQPRKSTVPFIVNMLDLTDDATVSAIYNWVAKEKVWEDYSSYQPDMSNISHELAEELDSQYELDLEEIEGLLNVVLLRADKIPKEFHI